MTPSYFSRERFNDVAQEVPWHVYVNILRGVHFHLRFLTGSDSSCQNKFPTSLLSLWPLKMLIKPQKALALNGKTETIRKR